MKELVLESEAGFKALFQYATIAIVVVGEDGHIEVINPCAEKLFGYSNAELIGQPLEILVPESLRQKHVHYRKEYFEKPKARSMGLDLELFARRKDGVKFPVEIGLGHYKLNGKQLAVAFITDITERKRAEEDLKHSEERYRLIFDGIHESFILQEIIKDKNGYVVDLRFLEINPATETLFQKKRNEIVGHLRSEFFGALNDQLLNIITQVESTGENVRHQQYIPSIGKWFDRSFYSPTPGQIITLNIDITRQKLDEEALLQNQSRLEKEAEALKKLNKSGNRLWRIEDLRQGLEEMLLTSIEFMGADKGNVQILDPEKQVLTITAHKGFTQEFLDYFSEVSTKDDSACGRALNEKKQIIVEDTEKDTSFVKHREIAQKSGFRAVQSTPLYGQNGIPVGMISTHFRNPHNFSPQDLNKMELYARKAESFLERCGMYEALQKANASLEKKVMQRTYELTEALEREKQLNEMKSRFVSMASHEFRTPLSAVLSSISLVESYASDEQAEKRKKHIARIKSSVRNLTDILSNFLSLDKLEQGKIQTENLAFNIDEFMEDMLEEVDNMLKKKKQKIIYSSNGNGDIVQDKKILGNIMLNLLSNAAKYSPEEKDIYVDVDVKGENVIISVKDNGIGIPEEEQKNLFKNFFRANNATNIQGTGLGLSIVKKYVEVLKGNISFKSQPGNGTTFTISFPHNQLK